MGLRTGSHPLDTYCTAGSLYNAPQAPFHSPHNNPQTGTLPVCKILKDKNYLESLVNEVVQLRGKIWTQAVWL